MVATASPRSFVPASDRPRRLRSQLESALPRAAGPARAIAGRAGAVAGRLLRADSGRRRVRQPPVHRQELPHRRRRRSRSAYMQFVEEIEPKIKPLFFRAAEEISRLAPPRRQLDAASGTPCWTASGRRTSNCSARRTCRWRRRSPSSSPSTTRSCGAMMVSSAARSTRMQQIARFHEETDRATRQQAWEASTERRLRDREAIEDDLRAAAAASASRSPPTPGCRDYRAFVWKALQAVRLHAGAIA